VGAVDEKLQREGRLVRLTDPRALTLEKRDPQAATRTNRDPQLLLDLLLSARRA
jgi:hypothetical protein